MSEEHTTKLRLGKTSITLMIDGMFQCTLQVQFEAPTKEMADAVAAKLKGLELKGVGDIHAEAVDSLAGELAKIEEAKQILIRQHKMEVEQMLQTQALQTREINRLKRLEDGLESLAGLTVPKVVR